MVDRMRKFILMLSLITPLIASISAISQEREVDPEEAVNGHLIREPELKDYVAGYRMPGIMGKPYDVTE